MRGERVGIDDVIYIRQCTDNQAQVLFRFWMNANKHFVGTPTQIVDGESDKRHHLRSFTNGVNRNGHLLVLELVRR